MTPDLLIIVGYFVLRDVLNVALTLRGQMTVSISRRPKPPAPKGDGDGR